MRSALRIACVGEAMVEFSFDGDEPRIGFSGDALNTAVYLRRFASEEHEVAFVSVVGMDPLSARMLKFINAEGVSTRCIARHPDKLPGLYAISTDANGERSFYFWRENSAARTLFQEGFSILENFDVIFLSAIALAILPSEIRFGLLNWLESWDGAVVFDSNYRPRLWENATAARSAVSRAWRRADIGLPSLDDEMKLFGNQGEFEVLERLQSCGLKHGVLKRGAKGPLSLSGQRFRRTDYPVARKVVDTTAAGDSFNGGYLAALYSGATQREAMIAGHNLAVEVIRKTGAIVSHDSSRVLTE